MLGENALDGTGGERIRVKALHQSGIPDSDVIVLELYEESVQPVLPWAGPADAGLYPTGSPATIAGWGSLEDTNLGLRGTILIYLQGGFPNELQEAEVPIVSDAACAAAYGSEFVAGTMVCAGYDEGGVDTCQGDSGGPLMTEVSEGEFLLIGTTWFGDGCARPGKPGVYSEIAPVSNFIASWAS